MDNQMNSVWLIIQARMGSNRLSGKTLMPLPEPSGPSVLEHIIRRITQVKNAQGIAIACPDLEEDDAIEQWAENHKPNPIGVFRGDEDNVLIRYIGAAKKFGADHVVRITGDNPCIDPEIISKGIELHLNEHADYTYSTGYPTGMNIEIVRLKSLNQSLDAKDLTESDREHVTLYVRNHPDTFKIAKMEAEKELMPFSEWRLTLDTKEDYTSLCAVFDQLYDKNPSFGMNELATLAQSKPWIMHLNKSTFQKKPGMSSKDEIDYAVDVLRRLELNYAASKLED